MKVTPELLEGCTNRRRQKDETIQQHLQKVTHLFLNGKAIKKIENLSDCVNLQVLYLYDNQIREIENLGFASKTLTQLYLQNNKISSTKNLVSLAKLKKLYLNGNCISYVEGLQEMKQLEELHLANQTPEGSNYSQITFDPEVTSTLRHCLRLLDVSQGSIADLQQLAQLSGLNNLDLSYNRVNDVTQIEKLFQGCTNLRVLNLKENPVCKGKEYRKEVIAVSCEGLEELDGKAVLPQERTFLTELAKKKKGLVKTVALPPQPVELPTPEELREQRNERANATKNKVMLKMAPKGSTSKFTSPKMQ